jgi:DNA repair protein RadC
LELIRGTIEGASVSPRDVATEALRHNTAAVILAHSHPISVAKPSQADQFITWRSKDASGRSKSEFLTT